MNNLAVDGNYPGGQVSADGRKIDDRERERNASISANGLTQRCTLRMEALLTEYSAYTTSTQGPKRSRRMVYENVHYHQYSPFAGSGVATKPGRMIASSNKAGTISRW